MPMGSDSPVPDAAGLVRDLEALLDGFDHTDLTYLTSGGTWSTSPAEVRDRTANELILRLWQARKKTDWPQTALRLAWLRRFFPPL